MKPKSIVLFIWAASGCSVLQAQPCSQPILVGQSATRYCAENNSGFVFVDNQTDSVEIFRWEQASHIDGPYQVIPYQNRDTLVFGNLSQTTYYMAFAQRRGCDAQYTHKITVNIDQPSIAGIIHGGTSACALFTSGNLTLSGQRGNITAWQERAVGASDWANFGTTSNIQTVSNITDTTYFRAIVKNGVCPADTTNIPVSIDIHPNPVADFTFSPVCLGNAVAFSADPTTISAGSITGFSWTLGDGSTSNTKHPSRTYLQAGLYTVTLTVTTDRNCRHDTTKQVEVYHLPTADFSAPEVCLNDTTVFTNLSSSLSGAITSWEWNFADFNESPEPNPRHVFAQARAYNVFLRVRTEHGCAGTVQKAVTINANPISEFRADTVCLGNPTEFYNLSSAGADYINRNLWSFGDGTSTQQPFPNKTYLTAGDFLVTLIVESDKRCRDTTSQWVRVRALPVADFSAEGVCDGETTLFQNHSTAADQDDPITLHQWNFGDGSTSSETEPSKPYLNPEVYAVRLTVRTANGCEHQVQKQAIVHRNPIADFLVQNVCVGDRAEFVNQSFIRSNETLFYQWDLDDGNQTIFSDFQHAYEYAGDYAVSLKVTSSVGGCTDSIRRTLRIYPLPRIDAGEDVSTGRGIPVQLSVSGGVRYQWFPTTGLNNSTSASPIASLSTDQTYVIFGTDAFGCENTDTITVFIIDDQRIFPTNFVVPNSHGANHFWVVQNIENYPEAQVLIFDKNGRVVYSTTNYQNNWDARNQNGEALPDGTYYYTITFPGESRIYRGAILVLRKQ